MLPLSNRKYPVRRLKKVVFPAPFGPMIELISPSSKLRLRSLMACNPPKDLFKF
jgi:hypothetical protein